LGDGVASAARVVCRSGPAGRRIVHSTDTPSILRSRQQRRHEVGLDGAGPLRSAAMTLQGRVLGGRYALGAMLGAGGMAQVYRARDRVL
jgi:hypothetical protein